MFRNGQWQYPAFIASVCGFLFLILAYAAPTVAHADVYEDLSAKYRQYVVGYDPGDPYDPGAPYIKDKLTQIDLAASNDWQTMNQVDHTWEDTRTASLTDSLYVGKIFYRLHDMTVAWATYGSAYYQNSDMLADIIDGLDWGYTNRYNETVPYESVHYGNWFHWEIAIPSSLHETLYLLQDELTPQQIADLTGAIDHFTPDTILNGAGALMTGANRVMKAKVVILNAILMQRPDLIAATQEELDDPEGKVFDYQLTGDGFYDDGSFLMHNYFPYAGGYGMDALEFVSELFWLMDGTAWSFPYNDPTSKTSHALSWFADTFEPYMFRGQMLESVRGRTSSRPTGSGTASRVIDALLLQTELTTNPNAGLEKRIIKQQILSNSVAYSYYRSASLGNLQKALQIVGDAGVTAYNEPVGNEVFYNQARVVHRRPDWVFNVAMHYRDMPTGTPLPRVRSYEGLNNENLEGWYTSDGMTYLYEDPTDYAFNFFSTVDRHRLPGITVDRDLTRPGSAHYGGALPDSSSWVGGVSLGELGSAGMDFKQHNYGNMDLNAKKSWFMFDDEVVALGADINSTSGRPIETIVDNRFLNAQGNNALTVDGAVYSSALGWSQPFDTVTWAQLEGTGGYVFPTGMDLRFLREEREGEEAAINPYAAYPGNDEFDSTIKASQWVVKRDAGSGYALTGSDLRIDTLPGAISGSANNTPNVFVEHAPLGDFHVTAKLAFAPTANGQEAGLLLYADDDNYIGISRVRSGGVNVLRVVRETGGIVQSTADYGDAYGSTVYLRIKKAGAAYSFYASGDGESWGGPLTAFTDTALAENPDNDKLLMGLFAQRAAGTQTATAAFDFFHYVYFKNYMTIWKDHGIDPKGASYAYITLPQATVTEVAGYAGHPDAVILENSAEAQAVKETSLKAVAVNFWKNGDKRVDIIRSDSQAAVMTQITGGTLQVAVSDPTRLNTGNIGIEIYKTALPSGYTLDPGITVLQTSPTIKLLVNVNGSAGRTYAASFALNTAVADPALPAQPLPSPAPAPFLVKENYDAWTTGAAPTDWILNTAGGTVTIAEVPGAADKSIKLQDTSVTLPTEASRSFTATGGIVTVEYKLLPGQANRLFGSSYVYDSHNAAIGSLQFFNDGTIKAHNGSTLTTLQNYAANTWYTIRLIVDTDSKKYDIYIDGQLKGDQFAFRNTAADVARVAFFTTDTSTGLFYVDQLNVYETPWQTPLHPKADATVRSGSFADTNFGTSKDLTLKTTTLPGNGTDREAYLLFDLNAVPSKSINAAKLRLNAKSAGTDANRTVNLYATDYSWLETAITWNMAPTSGSLLKSFTAGQTVGAWYELNMTEQVAGQLPEGAASYRLAVNTPSVNSTISFGSKEDTLLQPELIYQLPLPEMFLPVADATVRSGSWADTNYAAADLIVKNSSTSAMYRKFYMTFDYGSLSAPSVSQARLKLYPYLVGTDGYKTVKVYAVPDDTWSESTITWNNAPAAGELLGSFDVGNVEGTWIDADLTDYVNEHMAGKKISLLFVVEGVRSENSNIAFRSKESTDNKPRLELRP